MAESGRHGVRRLAVAVMTAALAMGAVAPAQAATAAGARSKAAWELNGRRGREVVTSLGQDRLVVLPGSRTGSQAHEAMVISVQSFGLNDIHAMESGDFDGDGYGDVVASDPDASTDTGGVVVVPGGPRGPVHDSAYTVTPREGFRRLGATIAVGDLDRDGYDDLLATAEYVTDVSTPGQAVEQTLLMFWGGRSDLTRDRATILSDVEAERTLLLGIGDVVGDARREVVVVDPGTAPAPDEEGGSAGAMQWCTVSSGRYGSCSRPHSTAPGIRDLAIGDFAGGDRDDVVLGQPRDDDHAYGGGRIWLYRGARAGLSTAVTLHQDSTNVPGTDEPGDGFGTALAAGDVNRDGKSDLVVGTPAEDDFSGRATLLYGSSRGLAAVRGRTLGQDTNGVPDHGERNDRFANAVSLLDVDGDGDRDVVIGAPGENGERGAVTVIPTRDGRPAPGSGARFIPVSLISDGADEDTPEHFGRFLGR